MDTPTYLRRHQAADYLQATYGFGTTETLAKLACVGGGPRFRKLGRFPIYTPADLDEWALSRLSSPVSSTAEYAEQRRVGYPSFIARVHASFYSPFELAKVRTRVDV